MSVLQNRVEKKKHIFCNNLKRMYLSNLLKKINPASYEVNILLGLYCKCYTVYTLYSIYILTSCTRCTIVRLIEKDRGRD